MLSKKKKIAILRRIYSPMIVDSMKHLKNIKQFKIIFTRIKATTDSLNDQSRPRTLFGKNIKNINIENEHAHEQTKEEQYIFENSVQLRAN